MKKHFIQQLAFAVALAVISSVFNSVQADPVSRFTDNDLVLWQTVPGDGSYWNKPENYVTAVNGTLATNISGGLSGRDCYVQDLAIPATNGYNIDNENYRLEVRAYTTKTFDGANLFVGVNKTGENIFNDDHEVDVNSYVFSNRQMRFSIGVAATVYTEEKSAIYNPENAVSMNNVYLGNGWINNRLIEGTVNNYAVVGITGTLHVLPDPNNDDVYRSMVTNNNKNRHFVIDKDCKIIVPEGAKLDFVSNTWNNNDNPELPFAIFPICGNVEGAGNVRYHADREDTIYVLGKNQNFTGKTTIRTDWDEEGGRFNHAYVVSGDGTSLSGIQGSEIFIENGNLVIQNNHILNNLGSSNDPDTWAHTRIIGSDAITTNPFVEGYHYPDAEHHDQTEKLTLYNTQNTTYYGAIMRGHEQEATVVEDGQTIKYHNYAYINHEYPYTEDTRDLEELVKDGNAALSLYCAGSDGGIRAESFVISSGRINFNGYFKGVLTVEANTVFSPDSWGWGKDVAIQDGMVNIDADIKVKQGGKIEFNFSGYNTGTETYALSESGDETVIVTKTKTNDVITITDGHTFDTTTGSIIDLVFMENDPTLWATEDAEYLLIKGGGFPMEEEDYSYLLTKTYGNMQTLRQFGLLGKDGNLYLITRYYVPEPSTWALMILGAAGMLYWRKRKSN